MSHEQIALGLGITKPTLYKHFGEELSTGAAQKRMEAMEALFAAARRGNAAAARTFLAISAAPAPSKPPAPAPDAKQPKAERLGKKEQAQADAVGAQAGTEWDNLLPAGRLQ